MSNPPSNNVSGTSTPNPRFQAQQSAQASIVDLLSNQTVGLVKLSDYRKRRAEAIEQKERDAQGFETPPIASGAATPLNGNESGTSTPNEDGKPLKKKKKNFKKAILSFGDDDGEESAPALSKVVNQSKPNGDSKPMNGNAPKKSKFLPNASVSMVPKPLTKRTLLQESQEREALRKEYLALQDRVKSAEFAIPFVFFDGGNLPGGTCRVTKGDFIWKFLDGSRKVGAEVGAYEDAKERNAASAARARREWAKVGVDDLMMVRGEIIIPPHYDFYYFITNKSKGPGGKVLFNYSTQPPATMDEEAEKKEDGTTSDDYDPLSRPTAAKAKPKPTTPITELEGANDDPSFTKVVDRRWYEKNKHIYPASVWQTFDPEKDYLKEVKRDVGGNAFFFS